MMLSPDTGLIENFGANLMREANWRMKDLQGFNLKSSVWREYCSWVLICGRNWKDFVDRGGGI